jgi:hypothetical protein
MVVTLTMLLVACADPPAASGAAATPWVYEAPVAEAEVSSAEVAAAWQETLGDLTRLHARPALQAWEEARALGDSACPREVTRESETSGRVTYWDDICEARERYWFNGPLGTYVFEEQSLERFEVDEYFPYRIPERDLPYGARWSGLAMRGQTEVYDEQSDLSFVCSCVAIAAELREPAPRRGWFSYVDGPVRWEGPASTASWLDEGLQVKLFTLWTQVDASTWKARANGSIAGRPGRFDTVELDLDVTGGFDEEGRPACRGGRAGAASVRVLPSGVRIGGDLVLAEDGACVACAVIGDWREGVRACVDLTPVLTWETAPW